MQEFEKNVGDWRGDIRDFSLYHLWLNEKQSNIQKSRECMMVQNPEQQEELRGLSVSPTQDDQLAGPSTAPYYAPDALIDAGMTPSTPPPIGHSSGSKVDPMVPSPFKRTLFWPGETSEDKKKRAKKEKLPAVVTSPQMLAYFAKKDEAKKRLEDEKQRRKLIRETQKKEAEERRKLKQKVVVPRL
uniref:Uncharacterized protein LOC114347854 n=1 Tax=Diabrotica virgifera virgifera TaxID=50390 RepID=A0A6P7HEZ6_DIAVI